MAQKRENGIQSENGLLFDTVNRLTAGEVEELLGKGVYPDSRDDMERTPLMKAAEAGKVDVMERLLDHGADVNAIDVDGETALMAAAYSDQLQAVKLLVSRGADLGLRNKEGSTALALAQEMDARAVATYLASQPSETSSYTPELNLDLIHEPVRSEYFEPLKEAEVVTEGPEEGFNEPAEPDQTVAKDSQDNVTDQGEPPSKMIRSQERALEKGDGKSLATPDSVLAANEERIEFDALDNKQVRSINEKIKKVLDKAGFEVGDYVIDTVFKGSYMAVLKPRSQENKRWRKLKKHPDRIYDPRRLTELIGGCAARRLCLAEGIDVSQFSISHFIELYYVKDLKLILTLAEEASAIGYTVRQLKRAAEDLRDHKDDHDPGKEIIRTLDQPVPLLEDPDLMALCTDKDRVLEELSKAERKKIRALIKARKPGLDEQKSLMDSFEAILSELEDE